MDSLSIRYKRKRSHECDLFYWRMANQVKLYLPVAIKSHHSIQTVLILHFTFYCFCRSNIGR